MKIKSSILVTVAAATISGCATPIQNSGSDSRFVALKIYSTEYRPKAEAGEIAWSDYYNGAYQRALASDVPGEYLSLINQMIWNSEQFEAGKISKGEFAYKQRENSARQRTLLQRAAEVERAQEQARTMQAIQLMQAMQPTPLTVPTLNQIVPAAPQKFSTPAPGINQSVSAFWTGKQQQVQTITNQVGWTCEYNYAGRTFWRTFTSMCPNSVQVQ